MTSLAEVIKHVPADEVDALLQEIGAQNTVRVTLHKASKKRRAPYTTFKKVFDEMGETIMHPSAFLQLETLRKIHGLPTRYLDELARLCDWDALLLGTNVRTNVGIDYVADSLGNNASRPAVAQYMAVSEDATGPAAGNTTLAGEITSGTDAGLQRVAATYAHTGSATSYTLAKTFTAAATHTTVQKDGIFTASSAGTLFVSATFTSTAMQINDQLTVTHTINI